MRRTTVSGGAGLRGGVLLPTVAPDVKWVKPLYDPCYDPLWAVLQDLELPVNLHSGTGSPNYGRYAATPMLMISEVSFYGSRAFVHMLLAGVFERFPRLKFVMTEQGVSWVPERLATLDDFAAAGRNPAHHISRFLAPVVQELSLGRVIQPGDIATLTGQARYGGYAGHSDQQGGRRARREH